SGRPVPGKADPSGKKRKLYAYRTPPEEGPITGDSPPLFSVRKCPVPLLKAEPRFRRNDKSPPRVGPAAPVFHPSDPPNYPPPTGRCSKNRGGTYPPGSSFPESGKPGRKRSPKHPPAPATRTPSTLARD